MPPQKLPKLVLKRSHSMMLRLVRNIRLHRIDIRITHGERAVSFLPIEVANADFIVYPRRRIRFRNAHKISNGNSPAHRHQPMHVVGHPAGRHEHTILISQNAADIRPKPRLHVGRNLRLSMFRAEHDMTVQRPKRLRHRIAPLRYECRTTVAPLGLPISECHFTRGLRSWLLTCAPLGRNPAILHPLPPP